jgi:hypothetical protein
LSAVRDTGQGIKPFEEWLFVTNNQLMPLYRIVVVGSEGVGKTCLLIESAKFTTETVMEYHSGSTTECEIWDTAGQETFDHIRASNVIMDRMMPWTRAGCNTFYDRKNKETKSEKRWRFFIWQGAFEMHRERTPKLIVPRQRKQFIPGRTLKYVT